MKTQHHSFMALLLQFLLLQTLEAYVNEHFILSLKGKASVLPSGDTLVPLELTSAVLTDLLTTSRALLPVNFDSYVVGGKWTLNNWSKPLSQMLSSIGGANRTVQVDAQFKDVLDVPISQLVVQADPTPLESIDLWLSFGSDALAKLSDLLVVHVDGIKATFEDQWLPTGVNLNQLIFDKATVKKFELEKTVSIKEVVIRNTKLAFPAAVLSLDTEVTTLIMEQNTISGPIELAKEEYTKLANMSDFRTLDNIVDRTESGKLSCMEEKTVEKLAICVVKDMQDATSSAYSGSTDSNNTQGAGSLETRSTTHSTSTRHGISLIAIVLGCACTVVVLVVISFFRRFRRKACTSVDERLAFTNREEDLLASQGSGPEVKVATLGNAKLLADIDLGKDQVTLYEKLGTQGLWIGEYRDTKIVALKFEPRALEMTLKKIDGVRLSYVPLRHDNIVTFLGTSWTEREEVLIVVEHMAKGSLRTVLLDDAIELAWPRRLEMSKDICNGLNFIRSNQENKLSRNLTAKSVFVDAHFTCKLDIFDYASSLRTELIPVRAYGDGDIAYRAPELLKGDEITAAAEVYALGIIFCEISLRRKLFEHLLEERGSTLADIFIATEVVAQRLKPSIAEDAPADFRELTLRCLSYTPSSRPKISEVLRMLSE